MVVCLQETYIEVPGKIPYLWRGNFHLTAGNGNSCGCITLLSPHLSIIASRDIGNRAHVLACQRTGESKVGLIIANIYAPNPNNVEKIDFFEECFQRIKELEDNFDCYNTLVLGDFNLNFKMSEMKNRNYTSQEKRVAASVSNLIEDSGLTDIWNDGSEFTWRTPNSEIFSTIDRILYMKDKLRVAKRKINWSLSFSDHAAVEVVFRAVHQSPNVRSRIIRIDPSLVKDPLTRTKVEDGLKEMIALIPNDWDPHMVLEFAKMSIRTVCEKVQADRKSREKSEEENLNEELDYAIKSLSANDSNGPGLLDYIEELRSRKSELVDIKGERLAERLGTKWYNEGEKSTKYFLRLLNRSMPDKLARIELEDGSISTDAEVVEEAVVNFYKNLYQNYDKVHLSENDDAEFFDNVIPVSAGDAGRVVKEISMEELRGTLDSCSDSAPGPDGIPYSVLRALWPIMGKIILDAWNYSLLTKKLPTSHKQSFLRLIPKSGKDLAKLTNWRPITLSNCDHKLITKTYSKRLCDAVAKSIEGRQTAYLKGRLINDNIRSMLATINISNAEEAAKGLIVSLDAKKAFDSVEHKYIETCLRKFGCSSFVPIFKILYKDLATDIVINGKIAKGFRILRGVKQGDALSCVIFIMCMEPLLRNIEMNNEISPITSSTLGDLPKVYAYADDVNGTIKDSDAGLKVFFKEYERLTRKSGLELNADKTEVMRLGKDPEEKNYEVIYLGKTFQIKTKNKMKINGILFQRDMERSVTENVDEVCRKMDSIFKKWSRRNLSTLGKIQIVKTFGLSQTIYLLQSMSLKTVHFKLLNSFLYKFIWNRHYLAAKAPERIKREIVNKPVKIGGLGMLDLSMLDKSLKIKAIGNLMLSNHPFMKLIKNKTSFEHFFKPSCDSNYEEVTVKGLEGLAQYRESLWANKNYERNRGLLSEVRKLKLVDYVSRMGRGSLNYFVVTRRGKRLIGDLDLNELNSMERHIDPDKMYLLKKAILTNPGVTESLGSSVPVGKGFKPLSSCTAKEIRDNLVLTEPVSLLKIGTTLSKAEAVNWGNRISKLTSVKHRNILLRVAHGDIYTKEKLHRFNLIDNDECPRCGQIETLAHKFIECNYVKQIWTHVFRATNNLIAIDQSLIDPSKSCIGAQINSSPAILTINAEILTRILTLKDNQNYLLHPKKLLELSLKLIYKRENKIEIKNQVGTLLNELR